MIAKASSLLCGLPALKALVYPPLASASQENMINTSLLCPRLPSSSKVSLKFYLPLVLSPVHCFTGLLTGSQCSEAMLSLLSPSLTRSDLRGELWLIVWGDRVPHGEEGMVQGCEAYIIRNRKQALSGARLYNSSQSTPSV